MKIVFLLSLSLGRPGPSVHILASLMLGLTEAGHRVHVIEQRAEGLNGPDLPDALAGRVTFDAVPVPAREKGDFARRYLSQTRYALATGRYLRAHRDADLVYVHSCNTLAVFTHLARHILKKSAVVVNVQDIFPENAAMIGALARGGAVYRVMAALQRYAYRRADAVITLSEDMKRTLVSAGAPEKRVHVIGLWSYGDEIACVPGGENRFLAAHPEERGVFRAVYAGNVGAMQNVELILGAAKRLLGEPRVRFLIVGDGIKKAALERYARENALKNVRFYPMQQSELAVDLYSMADVNLITLAPGVIQTAFPSKTTTCFAVGRPVIACVDPASEYARMVASCDKCFVVDASDPDALAARIVKNLRDGVGGVSEGERTVYREQFSARAGILRHLELFERLAAQTRKEGSS